MTAATQTKDYHGYLSKSSIPFFTQIRTFKKFTTLFMPNNYAKITSSNSNHGGTSGSDKNMKASSHPQLQILKQIKWK
jgi:hypothetical protein